MSGSEYGGLTRIRAVGCKIKTTHCTSPDERQWQDLYEQAGRKMSNPRVIAEGEVYYNGGETMQLLTLKAGWGRKIRIIVADHYITPTRVKQLI